ncbi:putative RNA polymerase sigma factor [unidentified eubacterium SCB49]|nr:putative RNA polymerase sigma factor [unidentified eubacterium SCB49]
METNEAFLNLIMAHKGVIYKASRIYTNNREDQEDLYQEIVIQLWKSYENYRGEAKMSTYMYRVAMNTAIGFLNKSKKQSHINRAISLPDLQEDVDTKSREQSQRLHAAINQLSVVEKGIVFLFLEGKSYREIGVITGFTENNIGTRMTRIKKKLKAII